ncbi:hypothetical protein [Kitasatospora terrestris]|uniref:Uncharacterized protein n=1 Tax=Kitasatospora terrestris TaxID=258051 RepID=A0ABP9ERD8_9ACTN
MTQLPLPYQPTNDPTFATTAATTFEVDDTYEGALVVSGPCPRCGALLEVSVFESIVRSAGGQPSGPVLIVCDCADQHPGRPENRRGCGAYWNVIL